MNPDPATLPPRAIRAILVDDETLLRQHLRERLERHPEIVIAGEAHNVQSAVELMAATRPEIIFLDVQMPPDNGFDLLPHLEGVDPLPAVIPPFLCYVFFLPSQPSTPNLPVGLRVTLIHFQGNPLIDKSIPHTYRKYCSFFIPP